MSFLWSRFDIYLTFIRHLRESSTSLLWKYQCCPFIYMYYYSLIHNGSRWSPCYFEYKRALDYWAQEITRSHCLSVSGWAYPINVPSLKHGWARTPPGLQYSSLGCAANCVYYFSGWSDSPLCLNSVTKWQKAHIRAGFRQVTFIGLFHYPYNKMLQNTKDHVLYTARFSSGAEFYGKMESTSLNKWAPVVFFVSFAWDVSELPKLKCYLFLK